MKTELPLESRQTKGLRRGWDRRVLKIDESGDFFVVDWMLWVLLENGETLGISVSAHNLLPTCRQEAVFNLLRARRLLKEKVAAKASAVQ